MQHQNSAVSAVDNALHIVGIITRRLKSNAINDRIFGTPSRGCLEGRLDASSANVKCNGSGRRAV